MDTGTGSAEALPPAQATGTALSVASGGLDTPRTRRGRAGRGRPRPARPSLPESQRTSETRALSSRKMMMVMLKAIMNVEIALISGVMPMRTIDQICSGSVL